MTIIYTGPVYQKVLHLDPRVKEEELKEIFGIQVGEEFLMDDGLMKGCG